MRFYKSISPAVRCTRLTRKESCTDALFEVTLLLKKFGKRVKRQNRFYSFKSCTTRQCESVSKRRQWSSNPQALRGLKLSNLSLQINWTSIKRHLIQQKRGIRSCRAGRISLRRPVLFDKLFVFNKYWRRRRRVQKLHQQSLISPG